APAATCAGSDLSPLNLGGPSPTHPCGCGVGVAEYVSPSNLSESRRFSLCFSSLSRTCLMPGRNFLFVPGPTNVPERILRAMDRAMEDHHSSAFPELTVPLFRDVKEVFKTTTGQAFIFPATGTGGWEAALVNTLSPGDRVIAPRYGQFSHLWIDLAQRHGLRVDVLDVEWGEGAPAERIGEILSQDREHEIKGVLIVHNETATGVTSDVGAVRTAMDAARHPALLYVDGVSSIGSIDFRMDEWKVDLAITGSQKGLMLPAGLAIVCASPQAPAALGCSSISETCAGPTRAAISRTRPPSRCSTDCANRSPSCPKRASTISSPGIGASPRACARRSAPGGSSSARRLPNGSRTR